MKEKMMPISSETEEGEAVERKVLTDTKMSIFKRKIDGYIKEAEAAEESDDIDTLTTKIEDAKRLARIGMRETDDTEQVKFFAETISEMNEKIARVMSPKSKKRPGIERKE